MNCPTRPIRKWGCVGCYLKECTSTLHGNSYPYYAMGFDPTCGLLEEIGTIPNSPSFTNGRAGFEDVVVRIAHDVVERIAAK